jgi:hypothetical protein
MLTNHACRHALLIAALTGAVLPAHSQTCAATSGAHSTAVVELYTSEGCSSCPPADRWLSTLKTGADVVALAFHVDYWDSLGWSDRFASPAFTQRQARQQAVNGSRFSYTPQVVIDGVDRKDWPRISSTLPARSPANVRINLARHGEHIAATVESFTDTRLAAYWAVTENGHATPVKAGENAGATLKHDHVVRELQPVPAWAAAAGVPAKLQFRPSVAVDQAHPRQVNLVVLSAATGRPLQALKLGC